jgi:biopolymer transport protein ExbD
MAISLGTAKSKTVTPNINVTPLVDVVLVLLIIFLVVTPLMSKTFWVHLPKQEKEEITPEQLEQDPTPPLVLRVGENNLIQVNGVDIGFDELAERLKRMFAARDDHVLFFDADDGAEYGFAVAVLDRAREGGAVTIAPLTQALTPQPADVGGIPAAADPGAVAPLPETESAPEPSPLLPPPS